jgi:hypothetical protein
LAHEVAAVHRHGLVEKLLTDLAAEVGFRVTRGRRDELYDGGVEILITLLRCDLPRTALVLARVSELQVVVELGGDAGEVDV